MINKNSALQQQPSASGPYLLPAIKVALKHLERRRAYEGESWNVAKSQNARIWEQLLIQSQMYAVDDVAPHRLRNDIGTVVGAKLGKRRWDQFRRWLRAEIKPTLQDELAAINLPMLHEARISNPKGGRHEISEAEYYLSYIEGEPIPSRSKYNIRKNKNLNDKVLDTDDLTNTDHITGGIGPLIINLNSRDNENRYNDRATIVNSTAKPFLRVFFFYSVISVFVILALMVGEFPGNWSRSVGLLSGYLSDVESVLRALYEHFNDKLKL